MIFAFPLKNPATKGFFVSTLTKLASNLSIYDDYRPFIYKVKTWQGSDICIHPHLYVPKTGTWLAKHKIYDI